MAGYLESFGIVLYGLAAAVACTGTADRTGAGASAAGDTGPAPDAGALRFFTGVLEGSDARVAVIAGNRAARLYFCGGDSTYRTLSRWVPAAVGANGVLAPDESASMGWAIGARLDGDQVSGSLVAGDGGSYGFHGAQVRSGTMAGLYEASGPCGKIGVIVSQASPEETPVGQGACIGVASGGNGSADIRQVNPILPLRRDADGTIDVMVDGATEPVSVSAAGL